MSETPGEARGGSGSNPAGSVSGAPDDFPVDVSISHSVGARRFKLHFQSSKPLVETLIGWKGQERTDIWLTWGTTPAQAREWVERALAQASVDYTTPPDTGDEPPPTRAALLLTAASGVVGFVALGVFLTQKLNNVREGVNQVAEEQHAREEQNRNSAGRALDGIKARTFRELEDADPSVRLQAVAQVGRLYSADPQAVPALVKRVKDDDRRVRVAAVMVLGNGHTKSEEVTQALRGCLADKGALVVKAAQDALAKLK